MMAVDTNRFLKKVAADTDKARQIMAILIHRIYDNESHKKTDMIPVFDLFCWYLAAYIGILLCHNHPLGDQLLACIDVDSMYELLQDPSMIEYLFLSGIEHHEACDTIKKNNIKILLEPVDYWCADFLIDYGKKLKSHLFYSHDIDFHYTPFSLEIKNLFAIFKINYHQFGRAYLSYHHRPLLNDDMMVPLDLSDFYFSLKEQEIVFYSLTILWHLDYVDNPAKQRYQETYQRLETCLARLAADDSIQQLCITFHGLSDIPELFLSSEEWIKKMVAIVCGGYQGIDIRLGLREDRLDHQGILATPAELIHPGIRILELDLYGQFSTEWMGEIPIYCIGILVTRYKPLCDLLREFIKPREGLVVAFCRQDIDRFRELAELSPRNIGALESPNEQLVETIRLALRIKSSKKYQKLINNWQTGQTLAELVFWLMQQSSDPNSISYRQYIFSAIIKSFVLWLSEDQPDSEVTLTKCLRLFCYFESCHHTQLNAQLTFRQFLMTLINHLYDLTSIDKTISFQFYSMGKTVADKLCRKIISALEEMDRLHHVSSIEEIITGSEKQWTIDFLEHVYSKISNDERKAEQPFSDDEDLVASFSQLSLTPSNQMLSNQTGQSRTKNGL